MVDKVPKYRRGIDTVRTIAPKPGVPTGVAMLPHHTIMPCPSSCKRAEKANEEGTVQRDCSKIDSTVAEWWRVPLGSGQSTPTVQIGLPRITEAGGEQLQPHI